MDGYNPLLWDCEKKECFNLKRRPKLEIFAACFHGFAAMMDIDGTIEINGHFLFLEANFSHRANRAHHGLGRSRQGGRMTLTEEQLQSAAQWWLDGHHTHTIAKHLKMEEHELATANNMIRITARARFLLAKDTLYVGEWGFSYASWYCDGIGRG
jgi:hypothetical protein